MEAASLPAAQPAALRLFRRLATDYGLIVLLAAMPVYYGIQDLHHDGNLTRLGNNLLAGLSIGSISAAGFFGTIGLTAATGTAGLVAGLLLTLLVAMLASGVLNVMIERVA